MITTTHLKLKRLTESKVRHDTLNGDLVTIDRHLLRLYVLKPGRVRHQADVLHVGVGHLSRAQDRLQSKAVVGAVDA